LTTDPMKPVDSDPAKPVSDEKDELEKTKRKHEKFLGIFYAAISGLFFTLCSVMVKLLKRIDPSEVLVCYHEKILNENVISYSIAKTKTTYPVSVFLKNDSRNKYENKDII